MKGKLMCNNVAGVLLGYTLGVALAWHYLAIFMIGPLTILVAGSAGFMYQSSLQVALDP
jgi:hypothetical protein